MTDIIEVFQRFNYTIPKEALSQTLAFFSPQREAVRSMMDKLSWDESKATQDYAINYLAHNLIPCEYIYLVLPDQYMEITAENESRYYKAGTGKSRWENAAKTIVQIGWPKVDPIIVPLFMWLLDSNWPGSQLIYDFLMSLPDDVFEQKTNQILNNPQNYYSYDYCDLVDLISDLRKRR